MCTYFAPECKYLGNILWTRWFQNLRRWWGTSSEQRQKSKPLHLWFVYIFLILLIYSKARTDPPVKRAAHSVNKLNSWTSCWKMAGMCEIQFLFVYQLTDLRFFFIFLFQAAAGETNDAFRCTSENRCTRRNQFTTTGTFWIFALFFGVCSWVRAGWGCRVRTELQSVWIWQKVKCLAGEMTFSDVQRLSLSEVFVLAHAYL